MEYKRILTIQDISCVGQCSMTVAMPILSACGHETCILPTALLSTHTGGFGTPSVIHFDDSLERIWHHWQTNNITFDAILVGYLGSIQAIHMTMDVLDNLLVPGGLSIVDPAMADHGKLYSGFDEPYVEEMKQLCQKADVIIPNITEAAMLSGLQYREILNEDYVNSLMEELRHQNVVLTGVGYHPEQTGAVLYQQGRGRYISQPKLGGNFHGTGDIFAACFTGSLISGNSMLKSVENAVVFTKNAIQNTLDHPAHWYGVKFEPLLSDLKELIK